MDKTSHRRSVLSNSLWSTLAFWAGVVVLLIATPLYIRSLGIARFGIYALLVTVTSPLGILTSAIGPATIKYIAEWAGRDEQEKCVRLVATTLLFNMALGFLGLLICLGGAEWLVVSVFRVETALQTEAKIAISLAGLLWFLAQISITFQGVVEGLQDYRSISIGSIMQQVLGYGGGTLVLLASHSLAGLLCWNILIIGGTIIYWYRRARTFFPGLSLIPRLDRFSVKMTFGFSSWQFINNLFGIVAGNADRFLLATFVNIAAVGVYGVARKVMDVVRGVASPIIRTFFPATSSRSNRPGESERFILDYGWAISALAGAVFAICFILGPEFLRLWVGNEVGEAAGPILRVFMITILLELPSGVIAQYMLGHGLTRWTALINIGTSLITLAMMAILITRYGMLGAAWSGLVGLLLTRPVFHIWVFRKYFNGVESWVRCFIDMYGVLLSISVGGMLGYLAYELFIRAIGRVPGFAASVIIAPFLVALGFISVEVLLMGHKRKISSLWNTILAKVRTAHGS